MEASVAAAKERGISATVALPSRAALIWRVLKHPRLMHYNRLIVFVLAASLGVLGTVSPAPAPAPD